MANVPPNDVSNSQVISVHILPIVANFSLNIPTAQEALGSTSEGSGPTTGQISPRP